MKRGGESVRERDALRGALAAISSPCPYCSDNGASLWWSPDRQRYVIRVLHEPGCLALAKPIFRRDATDFLATILRLHGAAIGDYGESDLVESHWSWSWQ